MKYDKYGDPIVEVSDKLEGKRKTATCYDCITSSPDSCQHCGNADSRRRIYGVFDCIPVYFLFYCLSKGLHRY